VGAQTGILRFTIEIFVYQWLLWFIGVENNIYLNLNGAPQSVDVTIRRVHPLA